MSELFTKIFQLPTCRWEDAQLHAEQRKRAGGLAFSSLVGANQLLICAC